VLVMRIRYARKTGDADAQGRQQPRRDDKSPMARA
jgi:hypothetical protein